jgi:hypothetical protein
VIRHGADLEKILDHPETNLPLREENFDLASFLARHGITAFSDPSPSSTKDHPRSLVTRREALRSGTTVVEAKAIDVTPFACRSPRRLLPHHPLIR